MKAVFVFTQGSRRQKLILDDLTLYVPADRGRYDRFTFEDEKDAAKAFNQVLGQRFSPRAGWKIDEKRMGEAEPVADELIVGYEPPEEEKLMRAGIYKTPDRLLLKIGSEKDDGDIVDMLDTYLTEDISELYLYPSKIVSLERTLDLYAEAPSPDVRTLILDAYDNTVTRQSLVGIGDLAKAIGFAGLTRLHVVGDWTINGMSMSGTLQHLALMKNPMWPEDIQGIEKAILPALEVLDLGLSTEDALDDECKEAFGALCASPLLEGKTLRVCGELTLTEALTWVGSGNAGLAAFYGDLTVEDSEKVADAVVAHKAAFARLKTLTLPLGELDEPDIERIKAVVANLEDCDEELSLFDPKRYNLNAFLGKDDPEEEA